MLTLGSSDSRPNVLTYGLTWNMAVVMTAATPKPSPTGLSCTSVTVATPTPARRISREIFTFGVVDTL